MFKPEMEECCEYGPFFEWVGWHYLLCIHLDFAYRGVYITLLGCEFGIGWHFNQEKLKQQAAESREAWSLFDD